MGEEFRALVLVAREPFPFPVMSGRLCSFGEFGPVLVQLAEQLA
ncbi:hypothetical protein [Streptomyces sp. XM4193]|nr:hypothetical protein [Streptomyces sp. XM4193]